MALEDLSEDIQRAISDVVMETAADIEAGVKLRMQQGPHTGAIYYRIDNGNGTYSLFANDSEGYVGTFRGAGLKATHQASADGEAPAPDTGFLLGSVYHEPTGRFSAVAGSRMDYAFYLEFGTFRMAPRPTWTPEVESATPVFYADIERAIAGEIK